MVDINRARDYTEPIALEKQSYTHYLRNFNLFKQKVNRGACATWEAKLGSGKAKMFLHQYNIENTLSDHCRPTLPRKLSC
jgi:hypothetical protein